MYKCRLGCLFVPDTFSVYLGCMRMRTCVFLTQAQLPAWMRLQVNVRKWDQRNVYQQRNVYACVNQGNTFDWTQKHNLHAQVFARSICQESVPDGRRARRQAFLRSRLWESQWLPSVCKFLSSKLVTRARQVASLPILKL